MEDHERPLMPPRGEEGHPVLYVDDHVGDEAVEPAVNGTRSY